MSSKEIFTTRAKKFSIQVIHFTEKLPNRRSLWIISDQLIRSACSIGANMTEANSASSKKDYINFYSHALKSANETEYWLGLLGDLLPQSLIHKELVQEVSELGKILAASILTMKKNLNRKI